MPVGVPKDAKTMPSMGEPSAQPSRTAEFSGMMAHSMGVLGLKGGGTGVTEMIYFLKSPQRCRYPPYVDDSSRVAEPGNVQFYCVGFGTGS